MGSNNKVTDHPTIFFDGVCNLCNGAVNLIIKFDKKDNFRFAPLQSSFAHQNLSSDALTKIDSIVLLKKGREFYKSDAAIEIFRDLSGGWPLVRVLKIFPKFFRDSVYDFIARHRYRFFGKDQCLIPTPELNAKFIA
jgi:predicted DCC family thiol-disulfide oxidoreductase YuxK